MGYTIRYSNLFKRSFKITPDWLLVWEQKDDELLLILIDTGSHSDLFG